LHAKIPNAKKIQLIHQYLFTFLGPASIKVACRTLMKLTSGLNFINVLHTAFTNGDPKNIKKTVKLSIFLTLLGSASVKAARRMLMKLTPEEDSVE